MRFTHISCRACGERILLQEIRPRRWRAFDVPGTPHVCHPNARLTHPLEGPAYDLGAIDGVERSAHVISPTRQDGPGEPPVFHGDPLFDALRKQLDDRGWRCVCGSPMEPALRHGRPLLLCLHAACGREGAIRDETLDAILVQIGARCLTCGAKLVVQRHGNALAPTCTRFPRCKSVELWPELRNRLIERTRQSALRTPTLKNETHPAPLWPGGHGPIDDGPIVPLQLSRRTMVRVAARVVDLLSSVEVRRGTHCVCVERVRSNFMPAVVLRRRNIMLPGRVVLRFEAECRHEEVMERLEHWCGLR